MASLPGKSEAFWTATAPKADFPALANDVDADVAVVGGGIVGLTAAYFLKQAGRKVVVLEARQIGHQATGRSTAKITSQHGLVYSDLIKSYGEDRARIYAEANQSAIETIASIIRTVGIDCDFERKDAYVFAHSRETIDKIREEAAAARRLNLPASFTNDAPLPFKIAGAVRFDNQAQFHPSKYLIGFAQGLVGAGTEVFEQTRATSIEYGEPKSRVITDAATITATDVIVATQMPVIAEGKFFAKAFPYAHPMAAAEIDPALALDGMFISVDEPFLSVRSAPNGDALYAVAVGSRYRTGHVADAEENTQKLIQLLQDRLNARSIECHWTNEDFFSADALPFIGRATDKRQHLFVAVGFNAWGITNGTAAGTILADTILGRANPWAKFFDSTRVNVRQGGGDFLKENLVTAARLAGGYLRKNRKNPEDLPPSEAAVFDIDGEHIAAYRDEGGHLHSVSAVCTHMKCIVGWNPVDRTWDCPCHGSRFGFNGDVISAPALSPLAPKRPH